MDNIREYFKQNADMLEGRRKRKFSLLKQVCIVMHACMQSHLRPHSPQRCSDTYFGHAESLMRMWLQYSSHVLLSATAPGLTHLAAAIYV